MTLLRPSRIAFGCSIFSPSRSQRLCCVVSSNASVSLRSHWNFPLSSLLYRSRKPSPSQSNPLIRSHRLPQNKNNAVLVPEQLSQARLWNAEDHSSQTSGIRRTVQITAEINTTTTADTTC